MRNGDDRPEGPPPRQSSDWERNYSAEAGLPFDADDLERRIVWIWGSIRSGSTWLLRLLCDPADPNPRAPLGFAVRDDAGPLAAVPFNEFLIASHVAPRQGPPQHFGERILPGTPNFLLADLESYALADGFADIWGPELRRLTLVRLAAGLDRAGISGVPTVAQPLAVIKEVSGSHAADVVMRLFPRSRMIFLVRDGRDIVDSQIHALGKGGWKVGRSGPRFHSRRERLEFVRSESLYWACNTDAVSAAYDAHPSELRHLIRYEELRHDTVGVLSRLREWLGLRSDPALVAELADRHAFENVPANRRGAQRAKRAAKPGLWRENLTRRERRVVNEMMGKRLTALGYEI